MLYSTSAESLQDSWSYSLFSYTEDRTCADKVLATSPTARREKPTTCATPDKNTVAS